MLYVGRGGTIAHRTFSASLGDNNFRVSIFGRSEAIKRCSNALAQDRLKRALLPTLPAFAECHADALAQAYESEVMVPSVDCTPADLQHNDTNFVTEPKGFSRSADGGSARSSGDWLAPRAGTDDIIQTSQARCSRRGLQIRDNAASTAWPARSRPSFLQDKHNDDISAVTKSFLQSKGLQPDLSVICEQPFRLGLRRTLL